MPTEYPLKTLLHPLIQHNMTIDHAENWPTAWYPNWYPFYDECHQGREEAKPL